MIMLLALLFVFIQKLITPLTYYAMRIEYNEYISFVVMPSFEKTWNDWLKYVYIFAKISHHCCIW